MGAEEDQAGNGGAGARGGQLSLGLRVRHGCHGPSLSDLVAPPHAAAALCLDLWFHISHPELRPFACISPQKARENDVLNLLSPELNAQTFNKLATNYFWN